MLATAGTRTPSFAQTLSLLCARREAGAIRSPPKTSIKPVYWNGTHLSVFEFRVEKELGYALDATGASAPLIKSRTSEAFASCNAKNIIRWLSASPVMRDLIIAAAKVPSPRRKMPHELRRTLPHLEAYQALVVIVEAF